MENPFEPKSPPATEAGPRMLLRRGNGYALPPLGSMRQRDRRHLRRQSRTANLLLLLLVIAPFGWWFGAVFGLWGGR